MILVLKKIDGVILEKEAYDGDLEAITRLMDAKQLREPESTYEVVEQEVFTQARPSVPQDSKTREWAAVKNDPSAALTYIAKRLGLE